MMRNEPCGSWSNRSSIGRTSYFAFRNRFRYRSHDLRNRGRLRSGCFGNRATPEQLAWIQLDAMAPPIRIARGVHREVQVRAAGDDVAGFADKAEHVALPDQVADLETRAVPTQVGIEIVVRPSRSRS